MASLLELECGKNTHFYHAHNVQLVHRTRIFPRFFVIWSQFHNKGNQYE